MTERRTLAASINTLPPAVSPEMMKSFISNGEVGDGSPPPKSDSSSIKSSSVESSTVAVPSKRAKTLREESSLSDRSKSRVHPIGLVPVTVRLRPEIAGALKRASLERELCGESMFTQQAIVETLITPWLEKFGYL